MRTPEQIAAILSRVSSPCLVEDFVCPSDIQELIGIFRSHLEHHTKKHTGPVTLGVQGFLDLPVMKRLLSRMENEIGPFELNAGLFFETSVPHVIHNDDVYSLPDTYKAFTIPLEISGFSGSYPDLCFFDQFYFNGPAKFFKGSSNIAAHFNASIYEYSGVHGLAEGKMDDELYQRYFTHLPSRWLEGLSLHSAVKWIPGTAIVFDSLRLHSSSDFRKLGITSKLGLSMFTRKA